MVYKANSWISTLLHHPHTEPNMETSRRTDFSLGATIDVRANQLIRRVDNGNNNDDGKRGEVFAIVQFT